MTTEKGRITVLSAVWCIAASAQFIDPNLPSYDEMAAIFGMPSSAEISAQLEREWDTDQIPAGRRGIKPVGWTNGGIPIYAEMPVYDEVPGAFVATVCYPGPDYRLPTMPRRIMVPAMGWARNAFRRKIAQEFRQCYAAQIAYEISPEKRIADIQSELGELEWEEKSKKVRDEAHDQDIAHICNMTRDQYQAAQDMKLKQIGNGIYHTDRFVDENGDIYKVDVKGSVYRLTSGGVPITPRKVR